MTLWKQLEQTEIVAATRKNIFVTVTIESVDECGELMDRLWLQEITGVEKLQNCRYNGNSELSGKGTVRNACLGHTYSLESTDQC